MASVKTTWTFLKFQVSKPKLNLLKKTRSARKHLPSQCQVYKLPKHGREIIITVIGSRPRLAPGVVACAAWCMRACVPPCSESPLVMATESRIICYTFVFKVIAIVAICRHRMRGMRNMVDSTVSVLVSVWVTLIWVRGEERGDGWMMVVTRNCSPNNFDNKRFPHGSKVKQNKSERRKVTIATFSGTF